MKALDKVRVRTMTRAGISDRHAMWAVRKNPPDLTCEQRTGLAQIADTNRTLYRAYLLKEQLREVFRVKGTNGRQLLAGWLSWASHSHIPEFVTLARSIRRHRDLICNTLDHGLSNVWAPHCTSWDRLGSSGVGCGRESVVGVMIAWGTDSFGGAGLVGVEQQGAAGVGAVPGQQSVVVPAFDRMRCDAELFGDFVDGEPAFVAEPLMVAGDVAGVAERAQPGRGERFPPAGAQFALVEQGGGLVVGVLVEQLVGEFYGVVGGGVQLPGVQRAGQRRGVVLSAGEADGDRDVLAGLDQGDVGDEQPDQALAFPNGGAGSFHRAGKSAASERIRLRWVSSRGRSARVLAVS